MKKIGFIDYYLDEWHANNYPDFISKHCENGEFEVKYAYAMIDSPNIGGITNQEWAAKYGVELLSSIDELIEKSDCIIVLSPDNSEMHYELSKDAVSSGKPVFIDKTFTTTGAEAEKILALAEKSGSPCFSSSALRFSNNLNSVVKEGIESISYSGSISKDIGGYIIHLLEPAIVLMGTDVKKVMFTGSSTSPSWVLKFADGRTLYLHMLNRLWKYSMHINRPTGNEIVDINDDFFGGLMEAMLNMFRTGEVPVKRNDIVKIMTIREVLEKSMQSVDRWLEI